MTCEHTAGGVVDSRPPDHLNSSGRRHFRKYPFGCLVIRTRKCTSCGERFRTFEMTEAQVMRFQGHTAEAYSQVKARAEALSSAIAFLRPEFPEAS